MKIEITGNNSYQLIDNKITTTTGEDFSIQENNGVLVLLNAKKGTQSNVNSTILINGIDMTEILSSNNNIDQKEDYINYNSYYEISEKIEEIILSGNSTLKIFNTNCLTEKVNIIASENSYIKFNVMLLNTLLVSLNDNSQLAINDSKTKTILANCSKNSTLKFINSNIELLIANCSGNTTIIKDMTNINNFIKNLTGNSNIITV